MALHHSATRPLTGYALNARNAALCERALRIVDRVMGPRPKAPHGFYDPAGFIATCKAFDARNAKFKAIVAKLVAKEAA